MNGTGQKIRRWLALAWWHLRFFGCAAINLDFESDRVQKLVREHFERFA